MRLQKDENLVETIRARRVANAKPLKVAWGVQNWTLKSNKCNPIKKMDAISKYHNSKIIHGWYISILIYFLKNIVCILTLEFIYLFAFLMLSFKAQKKEAFVANAI